MAGSKPMFLFYSRQKKGQEKAVGIRSLSEPPEPTWWSDFNYFERGLSTLPSAQSSRSAFISFFLSKPWPAW